MNKLVSTEYRILISMVVAYKTGRSRYLQFVQNWNLWIKVWQNLLFQLSFQPLYDVMQREIESLEFFQCANFEFIDFSKNNGTKHLLIFDIRMLSYLRKYHNRLKVNLQFLIIPLQNLSFQLLQFSMQKLIKLFALIISFAKDSKNAFCTFFYHHWFFCKAGHFVHFPVVLIKVDWLPFAHFQLHVHSRQQFSGLMGTRIVYRDSPRIDMWNRKRSISVATHQCLLIVYCDTCLSVEFTACIRCQK